MACLLQLQVQMLQNEVCLHLSQEMAIEARHLQDTHQRAVEELLHQLTPSERCRRQPSNGALRSATCSTLERHALEAAWARQHVRHLQDHHEPQVLDLCTMVISERNNHTALHLRIHTERLELRHLIHMAVLHLQRQGLEHNPIVQSSRSTQDSSKEEHLQDIRFLVRPRQTQHITDQQPVPEQADHPAVADQIMPEALWCSLQPVKTRMDRSVAVDRKASTTQIPVATKSHLVLEARVKGHKDKSQRTDVQFCTTVSHPMSM